MTYRNISRRTVAKGAAWGAPSVTFAAAAPATAASPIPTVKGSSYFFDNFTASFTTSTIDALIQPQEAADGCSFTVTNGPATVSNLSVTYWLPASNFVFTSQVSSPWSVLTRDSSKATKVGPNTGLTYYPYTTTYSGTGTSATTCGPTYSFSAPKVTVNYTKNPNGSYFYQFSYSLNGTAKTNPLQSINNP